MSRFMLWRGRLTVRKMSYTYMRRALGVLHGIEWRQVAYSDDEAALKECAMENDILGDSWKIEDWETGKVIWKRGDQH